MILDEKKDDIGMGGIWLNSGDDFFCHFSIPGILKDVGSQRSLLWLKLAKLADPILFFMLFLGMETNHGFPYGFRSVDFGTILHPPQGGAPVR